MIYNGMEKTECDISSSGLICQIWEKETSIDEVNKNLYSTVIEYRMIPRPDSDKIQFLNTQNQETNQSRKCLQNIFLDLCILKMLYCFRQFTSIPMEMFPTTENTTVLICFHFSVR